jgi:caa(3)-type oxidase subunit IV
MSDQHPEVCKNYTRRCLYIFVAVLCGTLLMVTASFVPLGNRHFNIALILAAACFNAFLVAGFLMHLVSERKLIYTVLIFTGIFFVGLMGLTILAHGDVPHLPGH